MRTISTVFTTEPYTDWHWDRLAGALGKIFGEGVAIRRADHQDTAAVIRGIRDADAAILAGDISREVLAAAERLQWVHCDHSGVNNSAHPEIFSRGILLTSSAGRSAPVLAEHVFYLMLSLVYDSRTVDAHQRERVWTNLYRDRRGLFSHSVGVIGLGHTGRAVAARARAFGMTVLGYGRDPGPTPEGVDRVWFAGRGDAVDSLLRESDFVVLTVRLTDETYHLIDQRALGLMKPTARLVNMARGAVVDEAALYRALVNGTIAGAASDVFETEPLPRESPLWGLPNFVITPHCTPEVPDLALAGLEIIIDNAARFRDGRSLRNCLTARDVYTKGGR